MAISLPPETSQGLQPSSYAGMDALAGIQSIQGRGGQPPASVDDPRVAGKMRSAMAFLDSAQELLQAAVDNMPELAPVINRATTMIAQGLEATLQGGGQAGLQGPVTPPGRPMMMAGGGNDSSYGGAIQEDGPQNFMLT